MTVEQSEIAPNGIGNCRKNRHPAIAILRAIPYNNWQSTRHNFIREGIVMSLRKVAGIIALFAVFSVVGGGGGNHGSSPFHPLGLR